MSRLSDTLQFLGRAQSGNPEEFKPLRLANDYLIKPLVYAISRKFLGVNENEIKVADQIFEGIYSTGNLDPLAAISHFHRAYSDYNTFQVQALQKSRGVGISGLEQGEFYGKKVKESSIAKSSQQQLESQRQDRIDKIQAEKGYAINNPKNKDIKEMIERDKQLNQMETPGGNSEKQIVTDSERSIPVDPRTQEQFEQNLKRRKQQELME